MAKIDDVFASFEAGFQNPYTALYRTTITDELLQQQRLRRKQVGTTHHSVWALQVGETGGAPLVVFYGHKPSECIKKALEWRGIPSIKRRPRNGQQITG